MTITQCGCPDSTFYFHPLTQEQLLLLECMQWRFLDGFQEAAAVAASDHPKL